MHVSSRQFIQLFLGQDLHCDWYPNSNHDTNYEQQLQEVSNRDIWLVCYGMVEADKKEGKQFLFILRVGAIDQ